MADCSLPDWENLEDDSHWVYEALAKLGYGEFSQLSTPDMSVVLALAIHLKRCRRTAEA